MAWGKFIGGTVGAIFGGPIGAGVGVGLGHFLDEAMSDAAQTSTPTKPAASEEKIRVEGLSVIHDQCGESGPGVLFLMDLVSAEPLPSNMIVFVQLRLEDTLLKSGMIEYATDDGELIATTAPSEPHGARETTALIYIPHRAIGCEAGGKVTVHVGGVLLSEAPLFSKEFTFPNWPALRVRENILALWIDLGVALVSTDGSLDRAEVRAIRDLLRQFYSFDKHGLESVRACLKRAKAEPTSMEEMISRAERILSEYHFPELLEFLYLVAAADGVVHEAEDAFIAAVCAGVGIPDHLREQARRAHVRDLGPYFAALELTPSATFEEVRHAYRKATSEYHPDKAMSLPPRFRAFGEAEQKRINEAYEVLKAHFGAIAS